jgi:tetratricopeptide (TPR) repeat protein
MQEVIRIEPRAASAWAVLAQCYSDLNEPKKELQLRIMAAHLRHDAEEWERLARSSKWVKGFEALLVDWLIDICRDMGYNQQALYCYRKLYSLDPNNVDALWDRASLAKEMGDLRIVRRNPISWNKIYRDLIHLHAGPSLLPCDPQTFSTRPNSPLRTPTPPHRTKRPPNLRDALPIRIRTLFLNVSYPLLCIGPNIHIKSLRTNGSSVPD